MGWMVFEIIINFLEMLTSCFLAKKMFQNTNKEKKNNVMFFVFAVVGTVLLTIREHNIVEIPDFVPSVFIFLLYAWLICKAKIWTAILWSLLNYLLIGIIAITSTSMSSIMFSIPIGELRARTDGWVMICVVCRLLQLFFSELIIFVIQKNKWPEREDKKELSLIVISAVSIAILMALWNIEINLSQDFVLYTNIFICLLILVLNFIVLVFREILFREKFDNKKLKEYNQLIRMQLRGQGEVAEMYSNIRSLKHDMNNHLHTISGYMQMNEYERAEEYIQNIIGEISAMKLYQSGNPTMDALIGSKTTLAKAQNIQVDIEMSVPRELKMAPEDMVILLGNLYDNAIDANLKIKEYEKRYINIRILYHNSNLIIFFENATYEKDKSTWITTKKNTFAHGFGIKNIDRIVNQYDGYCQRELKNNVFLCQIRIPQELL